MGCKADSSEMVFDLSSFLRTGVYEAIGGQESCQCNRAAMEEQGSTCKAENVTVRSSTKGIVLFGAREMQRLHRKPYECTSRTTTMRIRRRERLARGPTDPNSREFVDMQHDLRTRPIKVAATKAYDIITIHLLS